MPKWVDRMRTKGRHQFGETSLSNVVSEARQSPSTLKFVFENSGRDSGFEFDFSEERLRNIERLYRAVARDESSLIVPVGELERQLAMYLGKCVCRAQVGEWAWIERDHGVVGPAVVRTAKGAIVDVFPVCTGLVGKHQLQGARTGESLATFLRKAADDGVDVAG